MTMTRKVIESLAEEIGFILDHRRKLLYFALSEYGGKYFPPHTMC